MSVSAIPPVTQLPLFSTLSPLSLATAAKAKAQAAAASGASSTSGSTSASGTDATSVSSTFLNLLVKELQNQDPTAPMDSTAMVGQMISLNQLDQLISINSALTPATTAANASTTAPQVANPAVSSTTPSSAAVIAANAAMLSAVDPSTTSAAISAANDPNQTLDFSNITGINGGK